MHVSEYQRIARMFMKVDVPLRIWGSACIGMSKILQQIAQAEGYHFVVLRLATQEVGDLIGIPFVDESNPKAPVTRWAQPHWMAQIWEKHHQGIPTILALEEKTRAPKEVTQAAFQILTEKAIHEHQLPSTVRLFALDNPPTDEYDVATADRAENTRWGNIYVEGNATDWIEGYAVDHMSVELVSFIAADNSALLTADKTHWDVETIIYRTPRTWELANRLWETAKNDFDATKDKEVMDLKLGMGACVGLGSSVQFVDSVLADWISSDDILSGRKTFDQVGGNPQQVMRLYSQFLLFLSDDDLRDKENGNKFSKTRITNFSSFLQGLVATHRKDLAVGLLKNLSTRTARGKGGSRTKILSQLLQYGSPNIHHLVAELSLGATNASIAGY